MFRRLLLTLVYFGIGHATLVDLSTSSNTAKNILRRTSFDYIIVGGGTAGLTLARRLSESSSKTVLVLEAGRSGVNDPLVTIPQNSFSFIATDIDWFYSTAPQTNAAGQQVNLSQGKILGGDSAVNGLVWIRGAKEEYDAIEALGSESWNWESLNHFHMKSEKLNVPSPALVAEHGYVVEPSSLGSQGPVDVSFPAYLPIQHTKLVQASVELGHKFNRDAYSGKNAGVFYSLSSQTSKAVRETSEFAYVDPVLSRDNLVVFTHALVTKLDLDSGSGKDKEVSASGVFVRFPDGSEVVANVIESRGKVQGEVILSAGTVKTPQILELSGVGDRKVLSPLGINVKVDLPGVGNNYEDHTLTIMTYKLKPGFLSFDALGFNATLKAEQVELYKQGKGFLTFAQGVVNMEPIDKVLTSSEMSTARSILNKRPEGLPQDQFDLIKKNIFKGVPQAEYILFNSFSGGEVKEPNTNYISLAITHLHPLSRGGIHITSTNINDHPRIDPNLLSTEWDTWFLAKATAYGRKFFQTKAFKEIVDPVEIFPGPSVNTEAQWQQFVKNTVNAGYHSVGTASLMPKKSNGVVDRDLKVYGTSNLRVADLSILPLLLSAHTQPTAYAVGEKAAAIIRGDSDCY